MLYKLSRVFFYLASPREEVGKIFLAWYDLVPLISFLWLRGKCRSCRKKISWQYPLVELATGSLFVAVYQSTGSSICYFLNFSGHCLLFTAYCLFIISSLIVIFVYDLRHYIIPDKIIFPAIGAAFLYRLFEVFSNPSLSLPFKRGGLLRLAGANVGGGGWGELGIWQSLVAALAAAAFFAAIVVVTKGKGMGLGDVKLAFLMGLILGWPDILAALFLAFFGGALVGLILIILGRKKMRSAIPFGPFLAAATLLVMLAGQNIVGWYFNLFGF